jgi:hypothetical protein
LASRLCRYVRSADDARSRPTRERSRKRSTTVRSLELIAMVSNDSTGCWTRPSANVSAAKT